MCGKKPCKRCDSLKSIGKMARRKRRSSAKVGFIKRTGRNAEVDLVQFATNTGITFGGYGISNIVTSKINDLLTMNGENPEKALSPMTTGIVKMALGAGLAYAGAKYSPDNATMLAAVGLGMATSGAQNIAAEQLAESTNTAVKQFLGIAGHSRVGISRYLPNPNRVVTTTTNTIPD